MSAPQTTASSDAIAQHGNNQDTLDGGAQPQRLFIAVRLPPPAANQMATTADQLARRASVNKMTVRWVEPVNYHITVAYLGWSRPHAADAVHDLVNEICDRVEPFDVRIGKLGGFASDDNASVIWAGVDDNHGVLKTMAAAAQRGAAAMGFSMDARPYVPHLTLGRIATPSTISELILPWREQMFSTCVIGSVELLDSNTKTGVYVYSQVMKKVLIKAEKGSAQAFDRQTASVHQAHATTGADALETDDGWPKGQGPNY
jgi:RNA 2',3'-cyclic 3'-phosphodiesterase